MEIKFFEIVDRDTFIPAVGIKMTSSWLIEKFLLEKAGFYGKSPCILLIQLSTCIGQYDPFRWIGGRTMTIAHNFIIENFDDLTTGCVVDVEFILEEAPKKK